MIQSFGWTSIQFLIQGLWWTVGLSLITFVCGGFLRLLFALGRSLGPKWLRWIIMGYIQLVLATPLLILLFLSFYGLSFLGFYFRHWLRPRYRSRFIRLPFWRISGAVVLNPFRVPSGRLRIHSRSAGHKHCVM